MVEFGLRRAQGMDGGIAASRAAFIGGCDATSNVLAGKLFGIPVQGTHAHSWVMSFDDERTAFRTYAEAMPNNCVFLVDTYDTLDGVRHAIEVGRWLRKHGHELLGVRLDSGDLAELSIAARQILDEAGFPEARRSSPATISTSSHIESSSSKARRSRVGRRHRLVTAFDQPALGGVYKLSAIAASQAVCSTASSFRKQAIKTSTPGVQQVRRFAAQGKFVGDVVYDETLGIDESPTSVADFNGQPFLLPDDAAGEDLLRPIFRDGYLVSTIADIHASRLHARRQLAALPDAVRRLRQPSAYPVGLEGELAALKQRLIDARRTDFQSVREE